MSWFHDDFYSTRVSKRPPRNRGHFRFGRKPYREPRYGVTGLRMIGFACVCIGIGMLFMLWIMDGEGVEGDLAESPSVPATAAPMDPLPAQDGIGAVNLDFSERIVAAVQKAGPTVVTVLSSEDEAGLNSGEYGMGSGIIFELNDQRAKVATNNHVVQFAEQFRVVLSNGEEKEAVLLGRDTLSDLAVLEIDAEGIDLAAEFGNSDELQAGQTAIVIGNPLGLGYSHTITVGVVSSVERSVPVTLMDQGIVEWEMEVIQTDAAMNEGNSGGALVNIDGEIIGINSMKVADFGVEGLGFALPINDVKPVLRSLIEHGKVKRPFIGVHSQDYTKAQQEEFDLPKDIDGGIIVVDASGPAQKAGLEGGDVIVALDDQSVASTLELRKYLYGQKHIGEELKVSFYRDGKLKEAVVILEELPEE